MSIMKIKEIASTLKLGRVLSIIKSTPSFGNTSIGKNLKELFDLIEEYKEPNPKVDTPPKVNTSPKVDTSPKPRTRRARTVKKETTTE